MNIFPIFLLQMVPDLLHEVQVRGHRWPYHIRHSYVPRSSCDSCGTMWWSVIIHEQEVGGFLMDDDT